MSLNAGDPAPTVVETLSRFLTQVGPGHYVALMAYLTETQTIGQTLQAVRLKLSDRLKVAATMGYGPRFTHSTEQFHLHRVLQTIHELDLDTGVKLDPGTPLSAVQEVLDMVDLIQVTTVKPGAGGQTFIYSQVKRLRRLQRMLAERNLDTPIVVDGGIDATTAPLVVGTGGRIEYLQ